MDSFIYKVIMFDFNRITITKLRLIMFILGIFVGYRFYSVFTTYFTMIILR